MTSRYLRTAALAVFLAVALLAAVFLAAPLQADPGPNDWPQIRGPERDGRSAETGLLRQWPENGPPRLWHQPIGAGFSAISLAAGRAFTMAAYDSREYALALDPGNGEELWRVDVGPVFTNQFGDGPRSTPTVDDERVFVLSSTGRLMALAPGDGKVLWTVELIEAFGAEIPRFGYSASALIEDGLLLVEAGGVDGKALVALDKTSGETRWSVLDGPAAYSSPMVAEYGGVRQILFFRRAKPEVVSLLPSGEVHWTHDGLPTVITMPLVVPPDGLFLSATHDAMGIFLRVGSIDGQPKVEEAWRTARMKNHFNTSIVVDGHIYGFDNATMKVIDARSGEQTWARRGFGKGSLIEAEGHLIVLSDVGLAALVETTPEAYREKGRFQAMEGKAWTAPTLAGGRLYLRDQDEIVAYDLRLPGTDTPGTAP